MSGRFRGREVRHIAAPPVELEFRAEGDGPPIMILASTARGTAEFDMLAERLAGYGFRVLRPEPRGIGRSRGPMDEITFHDFAADHAAVLRHEGGLPAIVVGHAFGNWLARTVAADYPELTRGVVLLAAASRQAPPDLSQAIAALVDEGTAEADRLAALRRAFFHRENDPTAWLEGWYPEVLKSQRIARRATEESRWWAAGSAPILDLQAQFDPWRPEETRSEFRDEFGERVTIEVLADASHALPVERPVETADAIATWVRNLEQGG